MNTTAFRRFALAASSAAATSTLAASSYSSNAVETSKFDDFQHHEKKRPKLVFLGTGSSTGCPKPLCALLFQEHARPSPLQPQFSDLCQVSNVAIQGDPKENRDYRNNPSLLISHWEQGERKNVIIDVGKTFREAALRWMPPHEIDSLDAIVLSHHHMDAVAGLDDVRGFQRFKGLNRTDPPIRVPIPVYLSRSCLDQVSSQFPWLFPKQNTASLPPNSKDEPAVVVVVKRDVAALDVHVIEEFQPFEAAGLQLTPLPVWHGDDLICLGYSFSIHGFHSRRPIHVVYLSDISRMIPETLAFIRQLPPTDLLIVDTLLPEFEHPVHYSLKQALELSKEIGAKQTFLVGMSCDAFPPHDEMNEQLAREHGTVQFAHDGQVLYL